MPLFIARSKALLQKDTIAFLRTMPFSKPPRMTISATWFEQIQKSGGAGVIRIAEPGRPTKVDCLYDLHYKYVALLLLFDRHQQQPQHQHCHHHIFVTRRQLSSGSGPGGC
jgi:hypothetical protein